jgi:hypothetical protein
LLGVQLCGLRHDYVTAMERMERVRASNVESSSSEDDFHLSTVILVRSPTLQPANVTETASGADAPPVLSRAGDSQQQRQHAHSRQQETLREQEEVSDSAAGDANDEPVQHAARDDVVARPLEVNARNALFPASRLDVDVVEPATGDVQSVGTDVAVQEASLTAA